MDQEQQPTLYMRPAWRSLWFQYLFLIGLLIIHLMLEGAILIKINDTFFQFLSDIDGSIRSILQPFNGAYTQVYDMYGYLQYLLPGLAVFIILRIIYYRYYRRYMIGPFGVESHVGIIQRDMTRVEYRHARGVTFKQSILERLMGFGDIMVSTSGMDRDLLLLDVKQPKEFTDIIKKHLIGTTQA